MNRTGADTYMTVTSPRIPARRRTASACARAPARPYRRGRRRGAVRPRAGSTAARRGHPDTVAHRRRGRRPPSPSHPSATAWSAPATASRCLSRCRTTPSPRHPLAGDPRPRRRAPRRPRRLGRVAGRRGPAPPNCRRSARSICPPCRPAGTRRGASQIAAEDPVLAGRAPGVYPLVASLRGASGRRVLDERDDRPDDAAPHDRRRRRRAHHGRARSPRGLLTADRADRR